MAGFPRANPRRTRAPRPVLLTLTALWLAAIACAPLPPLATGDDSLSTSVAATLTARPSPTDVPQPTAGPSETPAPSASPSPTNPATATLPPPADGLSLNCDGTYQRVRLVEGGAAGRSLHIDNWTGTGWQTAWSFEAGDPMIRQLEDEAGARSFGGCRRLIVVPLRYTGSGAVLELQVFGWTGSGVVQLYANDGIHGDWQSLGEQLVFEESLYLFGEPNCCPCNRQTTAHEWNGAAFIEASTEIEPTYTGTPPPICQVR